MDLTINQRTTGCADGNYHVKAKGCIVVSLHWADENGALPDWQPFAYFPIEPNGVGMYKMEGGRAIPKDATHVLARAVSADFANVEEKYLRRSQRRRRGLLRSPYSGSW